MNKYPLYKAPARIVLGCDPGPRCCAFALIDNGESLRDPAIVNLAYVPNKRLNGNGSDRMFLKYGMDGYKHDELDTEAFVFEKCSVQGGGANSMVFETCMMAGMLRYEMGTYVGLNSCYAFSPSDWRYVVTGKGGADDSMVRNFLLDILPDSDSIVRNFSTRMKKALNLTKPITPHLRDAIGVALAAGMASTVKGVDLKQFTAFPEYNCG